MPRPTIEQIRGLGDVATTYQWNMIFTNFPSALNGGVIPATEALNLRMTSTQVPTKSISDQEIIIRGHRIFQSGTPEYNHELTLNFYETVDMVVSNFFLAWHETCSQTETGAHGSKEECECDIQLQQLNRQDDPIWLYNLRGCKLKAYTKTDLTSENGILQPSLTIKYDYFKEQGI